MADRRPLHDAALTVAVVFAVCTLLAVLFATSTYADYAYRGYDASWAEMLTLALADWWPWVLLGPVILWVGSRLPFEGRRWWLALAVHGLLGIVFTAAKTMLKVAVLVLLIDMDPDQAKAGVAPLTRSMLVYWTFVAAGHGGLYYRRSRERAIETSRLEAQLARARLDVLRMQLQPHFLFNTLHAISTLMHRDVDAAEQMMTRLGDLLRMTLDTDGAQLVPLRQELDILETYLQIEEVRFGDRLRVEIHADPETLDIPVPNLILQPLAENAIRHGIARRQAAGRVRVRAACHNGRLRIEIVDDGPGLDDGVKDGVGLGNTKRRLRQLYGDEATFELVDADDDTGAAARLEIPFER